MFLNSEFQDSYWFFFPLFSIYAAIPVISLILQVENHRKYLWYTVYTIFALNWVLKPLCGLAGISYNTYLTMPISGGFLAYALFGYLVSTEQWCRSKRIVLYLLAAASGIFTVIYTIQTSAANGTTALSMVSYHYFPSALTGAAIFVFFKHLFDKPAIAEAFARRGKLVQLIRTVSGCCMGVWLMHSLVLSLAGNFLGLSAGSYIFRFVLPPLIFAGCAFATWIIKKIPVLKNIV